MTNKPMLSVERELLERVADNRYRDKERISIARHEALWELRALLDEPPHTRQEGYGEAFNRVSNELEDLRALLDEPDGKNWEYFHNAMESERDYWKALAQKPAAQHQGEPVAWSCDKPSTPGAYWIRGFNLSGNADQSALVHVVLDEGEQVLMVNLHQSTTETDIGYWYEVDVINQEFEWCGPLYAEQPAPVYQLRNTKLCCVWRDADFEAYASAAKLLNYERRVLYAEQPAPVAEVPEGYCIMPRRLTAENGAKALLTGEFQVEITTECPECRDLEEPLEGCEFCDGEGEYEQRHIIPWDQIKVIYSQAVAGLARIHKPL